jgi:hypothetical protein
MAERGRREEIFPLPPFEMTMMHYIRRLPWWFIVLAASFCFAAGVQAWMASYGLGNFESDQAVMGLQMKHMAQGKEFPIYLASFHYHGTLYSYLSIPFFQLLGSDSIYAMRILAVILMCMTFALYAWVITRLWDIKTAVLTMVFLAIPNMHVLHFTIQPSSSTPMRIALTTLALILFVKRGDFTARQQAWGTAAFGMLMGLGLWTHPSFMMDIMIYGIAWMLSSEEWKRLWQTAAAKWKAFGVPLQYGISVFALLFCTAIIQTAFHNAPSKIHAYAQTLCMIFAVITLCVTLFISRRRSTLIKRSLLLIAGFSIGNAPQWIGWVFFGFSPFPKTHFIIPTMHDMFVWSQMMMPALFGITPSPIGLIEKFPPARIALWCITMLVVLAIVIWYLARYGRLFISAVLAKPLTYMEGNRLAIGLFFLVPVTATFFYSSAGVTAIRHILFAWPAACVILALGYRQLFARYKYLACALFTIHFLTVGMSNLIQTENIWSQDHGRPLHAIATMERYLGSKGITRGYADFWVAYITDFLTDERLIITPYTGNDRYPAYTKSVGEAPVVAYIVWTKQTVIPAQHSTAAQLKEALAKANHTVVKKFSHVLERLDHATVLERRAFPNLDVWIVADTKLTSSDTKQ